MDIKLRHSNIIINTGNILALNDITKKPGQNPTEEVVYSVNLSRFEIM